jgi:SAM-dependent methyltransferase
MRDASNTTDPRRVVEQGYDRVARDYARLEGEVEWPRLRWLKKMLDLLQPGSSVLDLGCGSGDPADVEIAMNHQVTGVDISGAQIELARRNVPSGTFLHGDAGSVRFPAASLDAVVSFYALEHLPRCEHEALLGRIHRWLKAGGYLLVAIEAGEYDDVVGEWLGVPMFISCFDPAGMRELILEVGFELLETSIETQQEQDTEVPYLWVLPANAESRPPLVPAAVERLRTIPSVAEGPAPSLQIRR